jgi:guanosine-3',5'-bis(diphosphate) 3'-pyrophosphohydrolase
VGIDLSQRLLRPSLDFERALRLSASGHRDQVRKGSGIPYVEHPMAVALILDRSGFEESVAIAGLLHDLVEDTDVTLEQVREGFGDRVAELVGYCSEVKVDAEGRKRPWIDRKRDHLAAVANAPDAAQAVILADKLHNLVSIQLDLVDGRAVWECFNASRNQVLWYHGAMIDACRSDDPRLARLKDECRVVLAEVAAFP